MDNIQQTQKFLKQRRFFTFLPIIVLPFVTLIFWILGGGSAVTEQVVSKKGLNTQLPDAHLKSDKGSDKLSFYEKADADSVKRQQQIKQDPNFHDSSILPNQKPAYSFQRLNSSLGKAGMDVNEERITNKIAELQKQIEQPAYHKTETRIDHSQLSGDVERLQQMMQSMTKKEADPEITELNGALEKILDIQHPDRVKEKSIVKKTSVFSVSTEPSNTDNSFFGKHDTTKSKTVFHNETQTLKETESNCIRAEIDGSQIIQSGSIIKLRLLSAVYVNGIYIPSGTAVFGFCSLEGERLAIHIPSIGFQNNILPVSLSVYGLSGLPGIYAPGSIARDEAKQTADQSLQSIGILNMEPTLSSQLAAAGIGAAKNVLSRKVKQVNVTVQAGYKVLLHDDNQSNNQ